MRVRWTAVAGLVVWSVGKSFSGACLDETIRKTIPTGHGCATDLKGYEVLRPKQSGQPYVDSYRS